MASLDKIQICGIRSFGPNEEDVQTIRFQKPLTLILGENGCGKSTIIECLRYLTAQKEPAGKGSFVYDPILTGKTIVKSFVKLQISDNRGNRIDLCRQLQVTRTKKTLTTKTLDNVITRIKKDTKEKQSISNRCADFSYEISRIFGVSRAILENVIFCTQEDSHWPLETDQKLKEKFDQIFDSDKYNKCVSKVREKMKKLKETCKLSDVELKHLEKSKQMIAEKKREIEKTKSQIKECEKEFAELNSTLLPIDIKLKDINEKEMEMSKNHTLKETKKAELKEVEKYILELKNRIGAEFEGTDTELKDTLSNFRKQLSRRQRQTAEIEDKINNYGKEEAKLSKELMLEQGKLGQLLKEEEINKERISDRNHQLNTLAVQLDVDSREFTQSSEESVQSLLSLVQKEIKRKEEQLKMFKEGCVKGESDLQHKIDKLREKSMFFQNEVTNKEKKIKDDKAEMSEIKRDLNEIECSFSKLSKLENQLSKTNEAIKELQKSVNLDEVKSNIQKALIERNETEDLLTEIEDRIKNIQQNASIAAELDLLKELMSNNDSDIRRLMNKHEDSLKSLMGEIPESRFKVSLQNHMDKLKRRIRELTAIQTRKEKEAVELETKRKYQKAQLRLEEENVRSFEEEIYEVCGNNDFEETLKFLQKQIDELQDFKGTLSSSEFMYQRYILALQKAKPCCPLCHRDFARQNEAQILVEELTAKVQEVPSKMLENKNQLEEKQNKYNKLLMLRSRYDKIITIKNVTLPAMLSELEVTESNLKAIRKELEDIENQTLSPQADEAICSSIQGDMALLDQLQTEKKKIGSDIEKLEARLGNSIGGKTNLEDLFNKQKSLRQNLKNTRELLEELQRKLNNHNEELQIQQSNKNLIMEEINEIQGGVGRKKKLDDKYCELKAMEIKQMEELDVLREQLEEANRTLNDTISKRNIQKSRNADDIEKQSLSLNNFQKHLQDIQTLNNHIKAYENKEITRKLDSAQKLMKKLESELNHVKAEKEKASSLINDIMRDLSNQEGRERELEDNLKYREKTRHCEILKREIFLLEQKCGNMNFEEILTEKRKLKAEEESIWKKKALIQGRTGELEVRVEQIESELSSKMFKSVNEDYQKELIKLVVLKSCAKDLERYATTMEYAMMTYHKQQMERVNSFIREYWRKIYQGNDIDYIEIQTDTMETTEKRRNYNYKVVQVKNNMCLDMRNRCSAGQKMLASLIIRMALAETFSSNCGILTLDEPTTNLDRKNIKNLAETLSEVLMAKQNLTNTNFQLIVITHDEEFLRELMNIDAVSEYVRVHRNKSGKTRVTREVFDGTIPRIGQFAKSDGQDLVQYLYDY